jgi:methylenetetrahydrofolate reductase (NADPH)
MVGMKIMSLYHSGARCMLIGMSPRIAPVVSFEFFPPADAAGAAQLASAVRQLAPLRPEFLSVTCGADGSTVGRTPACVRQLVRDTDVEVVPHLTCVSGDREAVLAQAEGYWREGRRRIVALRGDRPAGATLADAAPGFAHAAELVAALRGIAPFGIAVAAYPEGHPETGSVAADIDNLARKVAAGACSAITQFCFDTEAIVRYRDRCVAAGIAVPIVPGLLPVVNFGQMRSFAARSGATVPHWLLRRFAFATDDPLAGQRVAADVLAEQALALHAEGFDAFHFYTLNRAALTLEACAALGLQAASPTVA